MPSQQDTKQRALFDFLSFFNHRFPLANHPKPFCAAAAQRETQWIKIRLLALRSSDLTLFPRRIMPGVSFVGCGLAASVSGDGL